MTNMRTSWLGAVPFGGHPAYATQAYGAISASPRPLVHIGQVPAGMQTSTLAATAISLAVMGGSGALIGYLIGRSTVAALWGALAGFVAPPLYRAARSDWGAP